MDLQKKDKVIRGHMEEMHVQSMSWVVGELECFMLSKSLNGKGLRGLSFHWGHIIGQIAEIASSKTSSKWFSSCRSLEAFLLDCSLGLYFLNYVSTSNQFPNYTAFVKWRGNWKFLLRLLPWWERSQFFYKWKKMFIMEVFMSWWSQLGCISCFFLFC